MPEDIYVRLDGIKGECTEDLHPGAEGWIQIKSFSFGFGLKDSGLRGTTSTRIGGARTEEERYREVVQIRKEQQAEVVRQSRNKVAPIDDGAFDFRPAKLDKTLDLTSTTLWSDHSHKGTIIPQIELVACRYGGAGTASADIKIPFLRLVFEEVRVTQISLGLSDDDLPEESMEFDFRRVRMETLWTDNETGVRLLDRPCRAGWDREKQKEWLGE